MNINVIELKTMSLIECCNMDEKPKFQVSFRSRNDCTGLYLSGNFIYQAKTENIATDDIKTEIVEEIKALLDLIPKQI